MDAGAFFPAKVAFVAQGSLAGIGVAKVTKVRERRYIDE